jgi:antitoxin (DNA-binding transcriptional repressor) of toxin-antitoxin stability system
MAELALEEIPVTLAEPARRAARGQVAYLTDHGERIAAIVPAAIGAELEHLTPDDLAELLEGFAMDAAHREEWPKEYAATVEARKQWIPPEEDKAGTVYNLRIDLQRGPYPLRGEIEELPGCLPTVARTMDDLRKRLSELASDLLSEAAGEPVRISLEWIRDRDPLAQSPEHTCAKTQVRAVLRPH